MSPSLVVRRKGVWWLRLSGSGQDSSSAGGQGYEAVARDRVQAHPALAGRCPLGAARGRTEPRLVHRQVSILPLPLFPLPSSFIGYSAARALADSCGYRSLSRDNKHTVEKEQAIKLIRAIVEIGSERHASHGAAGGGGTVPLSDAVTRALIAVAEYPEDPFKPICVQTLTEIRTCVVLAERAALRVRGLMSFAGRVQC